MAEVPRPVRHVLRDPVDEASFQRMWRAVGVHRAQSWRGRDRHVLWLTAPLATAALVAALLFFAWPSAGPVAYTPGPGPLQTARGIVPSEVRAPVRLSDGSRLVPSHDTEVRVLENTGATFAMRLEHGTARFEVEPFGSRTWTVDCGLALVTVVGTAFEVERSETRVRVAVDRGVVRVDDRVDDRQIELRAGESVVIERPVPATPASPAPTVVPDAVPSAPRAAPSWSALARDGEYARAYAALGRDGIARVSRRASPTELLALADVARLSGHPRDAVAPLERLLRTHPGDANAGLAAFTLGVVHMDQLGDAPSATLALDRALALGLPRSLQDDALGRLVIARARSGDDEGARRAAARYLERFPDGTRRAEVRRWAP